MNKTMAKPINNAAKIKEQPVTREQLESIELRVAAYYANPEGGVSWQEVKAKIINRQEQPPFSSAQD